MSTLSGNASKGEKGKKFQQLKINLCTANKPSEPEQHQHKSSIQRKQHGMTPLGKVPTARRPTNLPSEKSEHSGNDPSVNLVPSGGAGWGNKQNETGATTTPSLVPNKNPPISAPVNNVPMPGTSQPVPLVQHYPPTSRMPPLSQVGHVPVHHGHPDMKTWAMMTQGGDSSAPNFLTPQSPLFQHEFPSLSASSDTSSASTSVTVTANEKSPTSTAADTQYGPGPSLRPQTEGSWIQGGGRPQGPAVPTTGNATVSAPAPVRQVGPSYPPPTGPDGARNNSAPSGVGVAPGGPYPPTMPPQSMIPPQYSGIMPPFMLRNSYPGGFPPSFQPPLKGVGSRPPYGPYPPPGPPLQADRFVPQSGSGANSLKRVYDDEDVKIRSIIKEEDLNQMATIGNDIGWAGHEDIDYNQKLKFSDDEDDDKSKDNRNKVRSRLQTSNKTNDRSAGKKENDKNNDLRSSKESLKEREKAFSADIRGQEIGNAWMRRPPIITRSAPRYQIPSGRFEEDDEAWQEKRRQKKEEMEIIMQRAKERKEEEEKRFEEQKQAAEMKLKKLEATIYANQSANKENNRDIDMLPEWEKEKIKAQNKNNENQANDDARKTQNAIPVPVVKDASEFRELTQLVDRSNFVKKDTKERENSQAAFSRPFNNNVPPRFQNLNRQNSGGFSNSSSSSGTGRNNSSQQSQNSGKSGSLNFGVSRHNRLDSESISDKDREWSQDDNRKDRDNDKYAKEVVQNREDTYNCDEDHHYENNFRKEYESKRSHSAEDEFNQELYHRDFDREREANYGGKIERKNSESDREKLKGYEYHRYPENEMFEKDGRWRPYDEMEKHNYSVGSPRSSRTFSESENYDHRKSREDVREIKSYNMERERDQYRKTDSHPREKCEPNRENERSQDSYSSDYKKETENDLKRDRDFDNRREKEREKKSPSPFDDRSSRSELKDSRFNRESRESLRDDPYVIQEGRSYPWADDPEVEEKPKLRREHYREDRGDRYSHAQRHPPGPITRAKLEAKELESDSKRNLTALVRSDKKTEVKKSESDAIKEKEKLEKSVAKTDVMETMTFSSKEERNDLSSAWKKDDKKDKVVESISTSHMSKEQSNESNDASKKNDDDKNDAKNAPKSESVDKNADDKRNDRRKSDRRNKSDPRNWTRYSMYRGSGSYGGSREPRVRRPNRGGVSKSSRRDSKYSESDYSDEVSGSGREDKNSRNEREKSRPVKSSKRYERDDRGRDYRMDERDYMNNRGRNSRDTYYSNSKPRSRGVYLGGVPVNKRVDSYGPPKSQFGTSSSHAEDKRPKLKEVTPASDQNSVDVKKSETVGAGKSNSKSNVIDRSWKKHYENAQEIKSAVSSPASTQTAEANEESFATASEGSDSEETAQQMAKSKSSVPTTKRSTTVVVTKTPRKNFRSSSRKRNDGRRTSSYSRKDSGSYSGTKRNISSVSNKVPILGRENDKGENGNTLDHSNLNKEDSRTSEKSSTIYADAPNRKNIKPRNRSNSRKNMRSGGIVSGSRMKNSQDFPPRSREKPKNLDGKTSGEAKDSKNSMVSVPFFKEVGPPIPAPPPTGNAWDKPLTGALRNGSPSTQKSITSNSCSGPTSGNNATPAVPEKNSMQTFEHNAESAQLSSDITSSSNALPAEKVLENLDGASPPVQTIIFENTNFKSGPSDLTKSKYSSQLKNHRFEKDSKLDSFDPNVANFGNTSSNSELPNNKHDHLQMALFNKNEDVPDMKLDFTFDSEFSKLTDDKTKSIELTHAMHIVQASTDAELNFKIASVKKVWDGEHDVGMANTAASFSPSFSNHSADPNASCYGNSHMENAGHVQVEDVTLGHNEVVFSNVSQIQAVNAYGSSANCQTVVIKNDAASSSSNVCKVKPQPQGSSMANVPQSAVISTTLSSQPPPMSSSSYNSFSCSTPQPNLNNNAVAATALTQMGFQPYGSIPPVPSSPVLYNSSQTGPAGPGLYPAFQLDNSQAAAARSAYSQFSYGLTGTLGQASAFNQQSVFMQTPTNGPPPDLYPQQVPPYRLPPQAYGNTQQITSQNTVLISSSSNSLMSASIKPSNQQISVMSGKTGYQAGQTSSQIFMPLDPATQLLNHNFMQGTQILQRTGNSVVPAPSLQASTSFYSSASGTGQTGYFGPGTNSALSAQAGGAIQLPLFNAPSATQSLGPGLQNFNSQLTQQYRSTPTQYMPKSGNASSITSDFGGNKTITISNQHDVLNQSFQPNSQMTSTKQRMQSGGKNMSTVPQGVAQHAMSQNAYTYQAPNQMRNNGGANKGSSQYPHPIQRPVSQGNNSNRGGNNSSNNSASHRMPVRNNSHQLVNNIQQPQPSVYYSASSGFSTSSSKLEASQLVAKSDSNTDSKLADSIKTINAKNTSTATEKNSTSTE